MQRLIEQPSGDGDLLEENHHVARVHYHLAVYQHFSDEAGETVPEHTEVEGRLTGVDVAKLTALRDLQFEWTLRLADGRVLEFNFVDGNGAIHSTGRGFQARHETPAPRP